MERLRVHDLELEADVEAFPLAAFLLDDERYILVTNRHAVALTGWPRAELVQRRLDELVARVVDGHGPGEREPELDFAIETLRRADGSEVAVEVVSSAHPRGRLVLVSPTSDAARRVDHEDRIEQLVHDLKNPVATIALEACLIDAKLDNERRDVQAALKRIHHNVGFLDRMINDLLDSHALQSGKLVLRRVPTDVRCLLEHVIERSVSTRDRSRVFLDAQSTAIVSIDDLRIERVVANLVANALKYSPKASGVIVKLEVSARRLCVSVIDAGTGLEATDKHLAFEKYWRAQGTQAPGGSGLGLYVCRKIIDAHGGRIDVDRVGGIGTRFYFEIPI